MLLLGLDIGGTKCAVSLGLVEGDAISLLAKVKFPTEKNAPGAVMEAFLAASEKVLYENGKTFSDLAAIGISCGGPLDSKRGVILSPPNLPGWDEVEIVKFFEEKTGVKTFLQNDANACAVAEWKFGAGRGCSDMVFLTFGTGLGAGLIVGGRLHAGVSDMAGEIGHVRLAPDDGGFLPVGYGKRGSAEGFCSGGGLAQLGVQAVKEALAKGETPVLYTAVGGDLEKINARVIADLADAGDDMCRGLYRTCGERLGETLSVLIDILNPEKIVLGGIFMRSENLLRDAMQAVIEREALPFAHRCCKVVPAGLGETIGDYAALSVAAAGKTER